MIIFIIILSNIFSIICLIYEMKSQCSGNPRWPMSQFSTFTLLSWRHKSSHVRSNKNDSTNNKRALNLDLSAFFTCTYTLPWQRWRWWRRRAVWRHGEAAGCPHTPAGPRGSAWWSAGWMSGGSWPAAWLAPRCGWTVTGPGPPGGSCDRGALTPGRRGRA